ncbi:MAG: protein BatD [Deltaproteobacteria bacterium]|nr:protein BatD [Deltaproteobacteria bacterium]
MKRPFLSILPLFPLLLLLLCGTAGAGITAEASLNSDSFPVDRPAKLVITVSGARSASIEMKEVDGLRFHNRGQSSRINIVNGSYSSSISNSYLVQPLHPGSFTIPPISVSAGGKTVQTKPITFKVTPANQTTAAIGVNPADPPGKNRIAFIRVTKIDRHYAGEIVPIRIKAYFSRKYRANINSLPVLKGDGVIMSPITNDPEQSKEQWKGETYNVLSWDTGLSGIKSGNHSILFQLDATLLIPRQRQTMPSFGGGFFDDSFFNNFFGGSEQKQIKVVSSGLQFDVIDLPLDGRPENFTGAIGNFQLSVSASPKTVETGEPITLTINIEGRGNFDRVEPPVFPPSPGWKTYTPTSNYSAQKNLPYGKKEFEQAIVAKNSTITEIPALSFNYFDPGKKRYKTITSQPIAIHITGSTGADN